MTKHTVYVGKGPFTFIWPPSNLPEETSVTLRKSIFEKVEKSSPHTSVLITLGPKPSSSVSAVPSGCPPPWKIRGALISHWPQRHPPTPVVFCPEEPICEFCVWRHLRNNSFVLYWCFFKPLICIYFHN